LICSAANSRREKVQPRHARPRGNITSRAERVLITGANGFIGSNLCRYFLQHSYDVTALVRRTSDLHFLEGLPLTMVYADLSDPGPVQLPADLDYVIHAASHTTETASRAEALRHSLDATRNLLDALDRRGIRPKRFVYLSSALVLGHRETAISEERPGRPARGIMAYVGAKEATEELLRRRFREQGLPVVILRPTDVYGPNDRTVSRRVLRGIEDGWPTIVGTGRRVTSICGVENVAQACLLACRGRGKDGQAYTLTNGTDVTWRELLGFFQQRLGKPQRLYVPLAAAYGLALGMQLLHTLGATVPLASFYPVARVARDTSYDISRTRRELGYEPEHDLDRQLGEVVRWYLQEKERRGV